MNDIKILILEDHVLARLLLLQALRALGYTNIYEADSGQQALAILKEEKHFDVLICDIQMPGIDGLSFLRKAAEVGHITAVILASAVEPDLSLAIQQLARLSGYQVLGDLSKPFSREELGELMQRYVPVPLHGGHSLPESLPETIEIEGGLGLFNGSFVPFYQPQVDLSTHEVIGVEALVRWQHPEYGVLSPAMFLETAKKLDMLGMMTQSVIRRGLSFLRDNGLVGKLHLSINLEIEQLAQADLLESVRSLLDEEKVPGRSLVFEVTESGLMHAPIPCIENLVRLRLLGCGISIDDFGAGFSSLQRVCEMPCSELKLDASLIRAMPYNRRSLAAVESMLHLARRLGIQVIAEGIETERQRDLLRELGCPVGQGFLFSRPLPGGELIPWLKRLQQPDAA